VQPACDLSVILAEATDNPGVEPSLRAIERACTGLAVEVLVVRPTGRPALPSSRSITIRELRAKDDSLVPERWGQGVQAARAPVFACLTTELMVHPAWAQALLDALGSEAVGAAGSIELAPRAGMVATAVYLVRFSAFLPRRGTGTPVDGNIPGDSAGYRREAVLAHPDLLVAGFWEAEFHRRFRAEGRRLIMIGQPLSLFRSALRIRTAMRLRVRHGRGYGITRVAQHGERAAQVMLAAPVVPWALLARILRRARRTPGGLRLALRALPAIGLLCVAWAWGEATGAWAAGNRQ
jgi:hypothetical protein